MKKELALAVALVAGLMGCDKVADQASSLDASASSQGNIRGVVKVNDDIRYAFLTEANSEAAQVSDPSEFAIEAQGHVAIYKLRSLMGLAADFSQEFTGGEPNPFGMTLWHQSVASFARNLANYCTNEDAIIEINKVETSSSFFGTTFSEDSRNVQLKEEFADNLGKICTQQDDEALEWIWMDLVGFDAFGGVETWINHFGEGADWSGVSAEERVEATLTGMMLSPSFLLNQ